MPSTQTTRFGAGWMATITPNYSTLQGKTILSCHILSVRNDAGITDTICANSWVYDSRGLISHITVLSTDYQTCRVFVRVLYVD